MVIQCQIMRLPEKNALAYLDVHGFKITAGSYYRIIRRIKDKIDMRSMEIAQIGFLEQHMRRVDTLLTIEKEMWENYHLIRDNFKRIHALQMITQLQPYITGAYDQTQVVMERQAQMKARELVAKT